MCYGKKPCATIIIVHIMYNTFCCLINMYVYVYKYMSLDCRKFLYSDPYTFSLFALLGQFLLTLAPPFFLTYFFYKQTFIFYSRWCTIPMLYFSTLLCNFLYIFCYYFEHHRFCRHSLSVIFLHLQILRLPFHFRLLTGRKIYCPVIFFETAKVLVQRLR